MSPEMLLAFAGAAVFLVGYLLGFFTRDVLRRVDRIEREFLDSLERLGAKR